MVIQKTKYVFNKKRTVLLKLELHATTLSKNELVAEAKQQQLRMLEGSK